MPSPMKTGTTLMTNSSIACASRNEAMISPPPINQISLPGCSRRRLTNGPMASFTNSTPEGASAGGGWREKTIVRPREGVHAVETFWCRAGRQPFEIAVGTRDIAVRAGRDVDDDFATLRHEPDLHCREPRSPPLRAGLPFVSRRAVGARNRHAVQPQVNGELPAMVHHVVDRVAINGKPRLRPECAAAGLEGPRLSEVVIAGRGKGLARGVGVACKPLDDA